MRKAMVIKTDGTLESIDLGDNPETEYQALRGAVGGWVQMVPLDDSGLILWCNEEGKMIGLPFNEKATRVWEAFWGRTDVMMGDCAVTGDVDWESELTKGLTPAEVIRVGAIANGL